ncbi:MAG: ribonuclease R [Vicinamibacterales bacterium]
MFTREGILEALRDHVHRPASMRELIQVLRVPRDERVAFRRVVKRLVSDGALVQVRGHRYGLPDKMDVVIGRFQGHPSGFGFVIPEHPIGGGSPDIYVSPANLGEAVHGDRVMVRPERHREDGRPEGRIIRVIERARAVIAGRFEKDENGAGHLVPFDARLCVEVRLPPAGTGGASPGEMVSAEITRWPTATRGAVGRVVEVLGRIGTPGVDTALIIRKYGLPDAHSPEAEEEVRRLTRWADPATSHVPPEHFAGRTDFRDRDVITVDGERARDFDDAISIERVGEGRYRLGVHIADVAYYVAAGGVLDEEAYERGTSVYFPERALHMFPEGLATGLCSLNPRVDRLVQSVLMDVDSRGNVVAAAFHDGVIRCTERMPYTDVEAILSGEDTEARARYAALVPMFDLMKELHQVLAERRRRLGSIDFDLEEPEIVLDEAGLVEGILASERNMAHRIIEEFMLLANETVARRLESKGLPGLYRVHEPPDPLKVEQFEEFVGSFGYSLAARPDAVSPRDFQRLLERIRGTPEEKAVALLMLRTMQKARYSEDNLGHFGLAFTHYTHFTSPIRRYPDLVVHRLLRESMRGGVSAERRAELEEELHEIARHASERERRAEEAERELVQWKKVQFMADKLGEEFEGFITGVAPFGLFVQLVEHFVEGMVPVSTMVDDYYRHSETTHSLMGENTGKVYRLGDRVRVQVLRADLDRRQIELGLIGILEQVRREPGGGSRGHRAARATARRAMNTEAGKAAGVFRKKEAVEARSRKRDVSRAGRRTAATRKDFAQKAAQKGGAMAQGRRKKQPPRQQAPSVRRRARRRRG